MKVLSLTEPFATLICEKKKQIETRSWKTHYRGELYIHASITKIPKEYKENSSLMNLVKDQSFHFGFIICKCRLVDCIYMTREYVLDIQKNHPQEFLCGDYQEGRYAWILEDIEVLNQPILAKGQLGICNYYLEDEVMKIMDEIQYGWVDHQGTVHYDDMNEHYRLQSPKEVLKNKVGVCWDQVELERFLLKGYFIRTFFLVYYDFDRCPTHTFLTYEKDGQFVWFEHAFEKYRGIHYYSSMNELLSDVSEKVISSFNLSSIEKSNIRLCEYKKPTSGFTILEFYHHAENGELISLS